MVNSMTGFASLGGEYQGTNWVWEIRSVNGRGLDVRTRMPEGFEVVEKSVKSEISRVCARGTINVGLRIKQGDGEEMPVLNVANLDAVIEAVKTAEDRAEEKGLSLAVTRAADLLSVRGVIEMTQSQNDNDDGLQYAIQSSFQTVLKDFVQARATEGAALQTVINDQINQIQALQGAVSNIASDRQTHNETVFRDNVAKIMGNADGADEARLTQELAMLAVKSDITEELDRLRTHVDAAKNLINAKGPIGRKFDFLTQEFNREANTLCSKSGYAELTQSGLALKTVIDQMREQVQNVE